MTGTIEQVRGLKRSYGYILGTDQEKYFFPVKELDRKVPMMEGTAVSYEIEIVPGEKHPRAIRIKAA